MRLAHPPTIEGLDHTPDTRLVFGPGCAAGLAEMVAELGGTRVLLVSDEGLRKAGHVDRIESLLTAAGLAVGVFTDVHENPSTNDVDRCLTFAKDFSPDLIIGLGGGSSLDTAKGCNFIYTNGGAMADYRGVGKASRAMLPFIAVPTTHGTGSETQSFALIADAKSHQKMACGDPKALPRVAVLDPELTLTLPKQVTTITGIDAISHAVESFVCNKRNAVSAAYARESFGLTIKHFSAVIVDPASLESRGAMLLGAAYAGLAIENSMLGAAHSAANPLTAHYGITHGHAVGLMLPHVVRHNAGDPATASLYEQLAEAGGMDSVDALIDRLAQLLPESGFAACLADLNVDRAMIPQLAEEAAGQWTANFNPRPMNADVFAELYQQAFTGKDK